MPLTWRTKPSTTRRGVHEPTEAEVRDIAKDNPEWIFLICQHLRPGSDAFMRELEHRHFTPGTPRNADFELVLLKHPPDSPLLWAVVGIPAEYYLHALLIATKHGLNLELGVPNLMLVQSGAGDQSPPFPVEPFHNTYEVRRAKPQGAKR